MPKISIITATYNRAESLKKNLLTVAEQTFKDIEHIIIDNLSDDRTAELVLAYQKKADYKVVYVREKDKGLYNALNKGIKNAFGDWLHFLHSDDEYADANVLQNVVEYLDSEKVWLVAGSVYYGKDRKTAEIRQSYCARGYCYCHTGTFFYKDVFKKYGLYNEKYRLISDSIFECKYYKKIPNMAINLPIVFMRNTGISSQYVLFNQWERFVLEVVSKNSLRKIAKAMLSLFKQTLLAFSGLIGRKGRVLHAKLLRAVLPNKVTDKIENKYDEFADWVKE